MTEPAPPAPLERHPRLAGQPAPGGRPLGHRAALLALLDTVVVLALLAVSVAILWPYTRGDLWYDEADYAFAGMHGLQANRLDRSDVAAEPDRLLRFRHYHPPFVAYMAALARRRGPEDRTLRAPAVAAGALTVALVYLCGVTMFGVCRPRERLGAPEAVGHACAPPRSFAALPWPVFARGAALACALVAAFAPANLRTGSHLLPWPFLIAWIVMLVWTLLSYAATARAWWLTAACAALAGLFVTSEYVFPVLCGCGVAFPALLWPLRRDRARLRAALLALAVGACVFAVVAVALWPAGLAGSALTMLRHYVAMAGDAWPVELRGRTYQRAPKWAYLYWYWHLFRPYLVLYVLGGLGALVLLLRRRLPAPAWIVLGFSGLLLLSAHRSHIIGPEYLAHVLPFLALVAGLFFVAIAHWSRWAGLAAAAAACALVLPRTDVGSLAGMDPQTRRSRWPAAARAVAAQWQPDDRMLAGQYGVVGRWYLLQVAGVPAHEWQVQALPASRARSSVVADVAAGVYRFVAAGSTVTDRPSMDARIWGIVQSWPVAWRSTEPGGRPSRLTIYRLPPGVTHLRPLPVPQGPSQGPAAPAPPSDATPE